MSLPPPHDGLTPLDKLFLLQVALVMVFYYSSRQGLKKTQFTEGQPF